MDGWILGFHSFVNYSALQIPLWYDIIIEYNASKNVLVVLSNFPRKSKIMAKRPFVSLEFFFTIIDYSSTCAPFFTYMECLL